LRIKAGTYIELDGVWSKAGELAVRGEKAMFSDVKVTKDVKAKHRVNLACIWDEEEEEPWLLITNLKNEKEIQASYENGFG
jgi:hypothetical protein